MWKKRVNEIIYLEKWKNVGENYAEGCKEIFLIFFFLLNIMFRNFCINLTNIFWNIFFALKIFNGSENKP